MSAELLKRQYALLKSSRQVLFAYCDTISEEDFTKELPQFGHGSIRNLLTHIANTYIHWLQNFALSKLELYHDQSEIKHISDAHRVFAQTDIYVDEFIDCFGDKLNQDIANKIPESDKTFSANPLTLFSHVLTHEFHHKGQIVSMSRSLGYTPVDTDMIRS